MTRTRRTLVVRPHGTYVLWRARPCDVVPGSNRRTPGWFAREKGGDWVAVCTSTKAEAMAAIDERGAEEV